MSLTPERDAAEQKRRQKGPEYPIQRISTTYMLSQVTTLLTRSTITASYDGLVGLASSELVVLASPRLIRCLYCYKGFRCLTKLLASATSSVAVSSTTLFSAACSAVPRLRFCPYMRDTMYLLYNTVDTVRIRLHFRYNQIQYILY